MHALVRLALALTLCLGIVAPASADWPAVIARDGDVEVRGLPAISGDGQTLAFATTGEPRSDGERVAIDFVDLRSGRSTGEWLVLERDDDGRLLPLPDDARGRTPWRRARNVTLHFAARGFRALTTLSAPPDDDYDGVWLDGAGLGLVQASPEDDVVLTDASGRERLRMHLPLMTAFCGMSDEAPVLAAPMAMDALIDPHTRTLVLTYGHVYASCMCDDDVARRVRHYRP